MQTYGLEGCHFGPVMPYWGQQAPRQLWFNLSILCGLAPRLDLIFCTVSLDPLDYHPTNPWIIICMFHEAGDSTRIVMPFHVTYRPGNLVPKPVLARLQAECASTESTESVCSCNNAYQ